MKTLFQIAGVIALAFIMGACKTSSGIHNSKTSIDWAGVYKGAESRNGKETITVLNLQNDMTYQMQAASSEELNKAIESNGIFSWDKKGGGIILKDSKTGEKTSFQVGENVLQKIGTTSCALTKVQQESITEKYWKLIEINGKQVVMDESTGREPFIILKGEENRVNANGGCNSLSGSYEISQGNRIKFSQMISTMMACVHMEIETELKKVFETTDNYILSADGQHFSLNRARMAPLARFEVVYLQ